MSKKIKILTPRIYEHSDFFHNAVDFAREHSLNTNELCLELSHYLVDNFNKVWKIEKPRVYKRISDLEAKLAEKEDRFQAHKQNDTQIIQEQTDLIDKLQQQLSHKEKEISVLKSQLCLSTISQSIEQDKISFCIEKLEWVQKLLLDNAFNDLSVVLGEIENQIEQLTHQHEDKGE